MPELRTPTCMLTETMSSLWQKVGQVRGGRNHFAAVCRTNEGQARLPIRTLDDADGLQATDNSCTANNDFNMLTLTFDDSAVAENMHVIAKERQKSAVNAKLQLHGQWVTFQLETGAACNVLQADDLNKLH